MMMMMMMYALFTNQRRLSASKFLIFSAQQLVSTDSRKILTGRTYSGGTSPHIMGIDTTEDEEKCTRNDDDIDTTCVAYLS